jgi:chromosome segregation ATPase
MTPNEMLSMIAQLRRQRDEARRQYDDLATEHVLAVNKLAEERDAALMDRANGDMATMTINHYERLIKERDEARADAAKIADKLSGLELRSTEELARLEQERNEAQKELSSIHRWIDKNHADGFIDSLTYLQNLERVTDSWYDRIDGIEADARRFVRERNEARAVADELASVAAHCLGWHDHECPDAAIKIAAALKRWKKSK